jgi:hypothetical protein
MGAGPVHQTVAEEFEVKGASKAITIGFTDQRLSPRAVADSALDALSDIHPRNQNRPPFPKTFHLSSPDFKNHLPPDRDSQT